MEQPTYSVKEIIELQFRALGKDIQEIKETLKEQSNQSDKQFARLDKEVADLKAQVSQLQSDNAKYKTIWGIGATIGASLVAFFLNKIF